VSALKGLTAKITGQMGRGAELPSCPEYGDGVFPNKTLASPRHGVRLLFVGLKPIRGMKSLVKWVSDPFHGRTVMSR
jgi:hypothetical protein